MPPRNFGGYGGRLALTAQRECTPNGGAVAIVPRRLDAAELVPLVRAGVAFENGVQIEPQKTRKKVAA